jgi:hypothetical protein
MRISVKGSIRRRSKKGFGPFKRTEWASEKFEVEVEGDGVEHIISRDLKVSSLSNGRGIVIKGTVKSMACIFGEVLGSGEPKKQNFSMLSVAGIEIVGSIDVLSA